MIYDITHYYNITHLIYRQPWPCFNLNKVHLSYA